jgi:hypothetical protein
MAIMAFVGCGDGSAGTDDPVGTGNLAVEVWGEDFVEQGIPASEFIDGWEVSFEKFLVAVDAIAVQRGNAEPDLHDDSQRVYDLTRPGPVAVFTGPVPAGRYDHTAYRVSPAQSGALVGNAEQADVDLLVDQGYSIYVEGTATNGDRTKSFSWGFTSATTYQHCESSAEVTDGQSATVQLTLHADHLFYDDLFAEDPHITFDVVAQADDDDDGEVTQEELEAFDIMALPNYGTGSEGVDNLWDFIEHLTGTLGHIDGEGHCEVKRD